MKKLLAAIQHPVAFYDMQKMQERVVLLAIACKLQNIGKPDVFDVHQICETMNLALKAFNEHPNMLDGLPHMKRSLFWHRMLSKFKKVEVSREDARMALEAYNVAYKALEGHCEDTSPMNVAATMSAMAKFWNGI